MARFAVLLATLVACVDAFAPVARPLAVRAATGLPVWPVLNSTLLAGFQPPAGMVRTIGFGDLDRSGAGQKALDDLGERLSSLGHRFTYYLPPGPVPAEVKGVDWLDVYNESKTREFPAVAVVDAARKQHRVRQLGSARKIHSRQATA